MVRSDTLNLGTWGSFPGLVMMLIAKVPTPLNHVCVGKYFNIIIIIITIIIIIIIAATSSIVKKLLLSILLL